LHHSEGFPKGKKTEDQHTLQLQHLLMQKVKAPNAFRKKISCLGKPWKIRLDSETRKQSPHDVPKRKEKRFEPPSENEKRFPFATVVTT